MPMIFNIIIIIIIIIFFFTVLHPLIIMISNYTLNIKK
jgi:hypothetical protein